ncbi:MAG: flagellin FliC3 [Lachnospiraceae bacterium]|nr:flagellin FliC3 [Lachnospiraceae bacterium]
MKINYNVSAMVAHSALTKSDSMLSNSLEKLSTGYKINHAKDNASGLAMAKRMNAQIRSLEIANQNSKDGMSATEIAEGALSEITEMVQRMSELATKAATGTLTDEDRVAIDSEIKQLKEEIERVADTTMYNGEVLLNGNFDLKGYTSDENVKVVTYSDEVRSGLYEITGLTAALDADGNIDPSSVSMTLDPDKFGTGAKYTVERDSIYIEGSNGLKMELQIKGNVSKDVTLDITGIGAMGVQIGTNEGQTLDIRIPTVSLRAMGIDRVDCSTEENAREFMDKIKGALKYISDARSSLGAYVNRLEHTVGTLDISEENMTAAYSRIMDTDMAEEMSEYSKNQVLVQAGTSMLAQANERPSQVLQLLQ